MACVQPITEKQHRTWTRFDHIKERERVYLPVLAIRVQGEAHLTRSHGPAAGLKGACLLHSTSRAQVRLFFYSHSTDDVISPRKRYDG